MTSKNLSNNHQISKICSVEGCNKKMLSRSVCHSHYKQKRASGEFVLAIRTTCSVEGCGGKHLAKGLCVHHYGRTRYGRPILGGKPHNPLTNPQEFWAKIKTFESDGCWEWQGHSNTAGYGVVIYKGQKWMAHRLAWSLANNKVPQLFILHSCDNPPCCNPNHLREGTAKENSQDAKERKRFRIKLSDEDIIEIRRLLKLGHTQTEIGNKFGVGHTMISNIKLGKTRAEVQ